MQEIVVSYVNEEKKKKEMLINMYCWYGTFSLARKQEQKILNEYAPNNMINYFQVLDLTFNKWVNDLMNQKFNERFTTQLRNELESGKELEYTTIKFLLSTMKPLLAGWLIDCYNQLISSHGKQIILAGWRAPGISGAV